MSTFTAKLKANSEAALRKLELARQRAIVKLGDRVIDATPVGAPETWQRGGAAAVEAGYQPGHMKANWRTNVGAPTTEELTDGNTPYAGPSDVSGALAKDELRSNLGSGDCTVHITNNVPYARSIEDGRSRGQAPSGIVKLAAADWKNIVHQAAKEVGL